MATLHDELRGLTLGPVHRHELAERLLRSAAALRVSVSPTDRRGRAATDDVIRVAKTLIAPPLPDLSDVELLDA